MEMVIEVNFVLILLSGGFLLVTSLIFSFIGIDTTRVSNDVDYPNWE